MPSIRDTIARVAEEEGIDPSYALAVAERESSFRPTAKNSKSIYGLFQMTGNLRNKYGSGNSSDPEEQTRAFARFTTDLKADMTKRLGREPSNAETYAGHHFGPGRASNIIGGKHAGLSASDVFSPYELSINPHLSKGGTVGDITDGITADIEKRMAKYGGGQNSANSAPGRQNPSNPDGQASDFAAYGEPVELPKGEAKSGAQNGSDTPGANPGIGVASAGALPPEQGGAGIPATPGNDRFQQLPESGRLVDRRNEPASAKPQPTEILSEALGERYGKPYTGGRTYPTPHGRTEPLATEAGIKDIPNYGNKTNPESDKYPGETEREKESERYWAEEQKKHDQRHQQGQQAQQMQAVPGIPIPALPQVSQPTSGYGLQ